MPLPWKPRYQYNGVGWCTLLLCNGNSSYSSLSLSRSPFFLWHMNFSAADLRNYWTEFHETWWSYKYMFLVDPKVFRFVVNGSKPYFRGSKGVGVTIESYEKLEISYINVDSEHIELYSNMGMRMQRTLFLMMRLKSFHPEVDKSWQSRRECQ